MYLSICVVLLGNKSKNLNKNVDPFNIHISNSALSNAPKYMENSTSITEL